MKSKLNIMTSTKIFVIAFAIVSCGFGLRAEEAKPDAASSPSNQKEFKTPKEAAEALVKAADTFDVAALKEILGPDAEDIISSEDQVADKNRAAAFAAKGKEKISVGSDKDPNIAIVTVGKDNFPLPIPLVRNKAKWTFDTKVGREEILNRTIGRNELDAIGICRGFVEAQQEYALQKHDDSKVNQFAQKIISTPGKHDGLAWKEADGTWGGPVGEGIARAIEQGYSKKEEPFHGYFFKVLKGQGPDAPMGEMDFVVNGAMISGFALVAAPAQYRVTGVQTFMVGADGVVYEKDMGADTLKQFESMERYNPDKSWKVTDDDGTEDEADDDEGDASE